MPRYDLKHFKLLNMKPLRSMIKTRVKLLNIRAINFWGNL